MGYTLAHPIGAAQPLRRRSVPTEDPLDAMRGIVIGALLSLLGFWLPLALILAF